MLRDAGEEGLDERLVVTPAGGASKVAYVGTILHGQSLNVAVLLDSDSEGLGACKQIVHQWVLDKKNVLCLGDILGVEQDRTLEDLFSEAYYVEHVNAAYRKELGGELLAVLPDKTKPVVVRVEEALRVKGVETFNKGRVAKRIMLDLAKKRLSSLQPDTVGQFKKVISAINRTVASWRRRS